MKRHLGPLMRLGIVLTGFWLVGGTPMMAFREIGSQYEAIRAGYGLCLKLNANLPADKWADCGKEMEDSFRQQRVYSRYAWGTAALAAAAIAIAGWIMSLLLYWSARWIMAGRNSHGTDRA